MFGHVDQRMEARHHIARQVERAFGRPPDRQGRAVGLESSNVRIAVVGLDQDIDIHRVPII
jgi:hypothetical protein